MDAYEMGLANAFLLKHRFVETTPRSGRKLRAGEKEIGNILLRADESELMSFRSLLAGQGFHLIVKDDFDLADLAPGASVFLAVREQSDDAFIKIGEDMVMDRMRLRDTESQEEIATWFLFLWFQHMAMLYSHIDRGVTEVSRHNEAEFSRSTFESLIIESIDSLRKAEMSAGNFYGEYLISERKNDTPRRINKFLDVMTESGMLNYASRSDDVIYRQTLLSSVEISESFVADMDALVPKAREIAAITNLPAGLQEGDDVTD